MTSGVCVSLKYFTIVSTCCDIVIWWSGNNICFSCLCYFPLYCSVFLSAIDGRAISDTAEVNREANQTKLTERVWLMDLWEIWKKLATRGHHCDFQVCQWLYITHFLFPHMHHACDIHFMIDFLILNNVASRITAANRNVR